MTIDDQLLANAPNFRDLGGRATSDGARVRRGMVYRSDSLAWLDESDLATLERIGLRQVMDLRADVERAKHADRLPDGVEYTTLDVNPKPAGGTRGTGEGADRHFAGDLASVLAEPELAREVLSDGGGERFMHNVNRVLVTSDAARAGYAELLTRVATGPTAAVFHCSAGKDRTGWAAALILSLLGVPWATIVSDYLVSNLRMDNIQRWIYAKSDENGIDRTLVDPILGVRRRYLQTAFAEVERVHGTVEEYVRDGLKLDPEIIDALRARLLEWP
ncbi:protein-tyrosine phosphatase [Lipingzhangella halophila]|uniref:Protein-tyrosine phosphatase n=1 Tax=Lipingzhangella halophila TaxID=1783352 RepID=A0A7W7W4R6_9ACTN|nr:tyrosine-protein phosphatase [Lipingzhangella halophila]MBB4933104.1 protein-tyrosine phosphatase [Lipingzhangella halophila]